MMDLQYLKRLLKFISYFSALIQYFKNTMPNTLKRNDNYVYVGSY